MAEEKALTFLEEQAGAGLENIDIRDMSLPFLRIAQSLSPQLEKDNEAYIPGLELGMFFNTVTKKIYGREINLIPIKYERAWVEWRPDRGGFVATHPQNSIKVDKTNFKEWQYGENIVQDTMLFYCMIEGHLQDGPIVFPLSVTGLKHGKNWMTQINMTKLPSGSQAPLFSSVWKVVSSKINGKKGTYYQIGGKATNISRTRFINSTEYQNFISPNIEGLKFAVVDMKQLSDGSDEVIEDEETVTEDGTKVGY